MSRFQFGLINLNWIVLLLVALPTFAKPIPTQLWSRWETHDPNSTQIIDHQAFDYFLKRYVRHEPLLHANLVDYAHISDSDLSTLQLYIARLAHVKIRRFNRNEQLAYWANLYNALVIELIAKNYPLESIRDIRIGTFYQNSPWDVDLIKVEGSKISLDDIRNRILRPVWRDPRILYLLTNGTISAPSIQIEAYTGKNINSYLNQNAKDFINNPYKVNVVNQRLFTTDLYNWYQQDFGPSSNAIIKHLLRYADADLRAKLTSITDITKTSYNWRLNTVHRAS
ncbi:MAG: DUF547 domain-containing protein [Gammaproteobacteria bacterium]